MQIDDKKNKLIRKALRKLSEEAIHSHSHMMCLIWIDLKSYAFIKKIPSTIVKLCVWFDVLVIILIPKVTCQFRFLFLLTLTAMSIILDMLNFDWTYTYECPTVKSFRGHACILFYRLWLCACVCIKSCCIHARLYLRSNSYKYWTSVEISRHLEINFQNNVLFGFFKVLVFQATVPWRTRRVSPSRSYSCSRSTLAYTKSKSV